MANLRPRPRGFGTRLSVGIGLALFLTLAGTGVAQAHWAATQTITGGVKTGKLGIEIAPTTILDHIYSSPLTARSVIYPITVKNTSAFPATPRLAFTTGAVQTLGSGTFGTTAASVNSWRSPSTTCPSQSGTMSNWAAATASSAALAAGASVTYCVQSALSLPQRYTLAGNAVAVTATATLTAGTWTKTASTSLNQSVANGITPGTPTLVSKTADTVTITWTAPTDAAGILGYRIYRDGGTSKIGSDITDLSHLTFTDTGLTAGQSYTYRVVGYVDGTPGVPLGAGTTESPRSGLLTATPPRPSMTISGNQGFCITSLTAMYEKCDGTANQAWKLDVTQPTTILNTGVSLVPNPPAPANLLSAKTGGIEMSATLGANSTWTLTAMGGAGVYQIHSVGQPGKCLARTGQNLILTNCAAGGSNQQSFTIATVN